LASRSDERTSLPHANGRDADGWIERTTHLPSLHLQPKRSHRSLSPALDAPGLEEVLVDSFEGGEDGRSFEVEFLELEGDVVVFVFLVMMEMDGWRLREEGRKEG